MDRKFKHMVQKRHVNVDLAFKALMERAVVIRSSRTSTYHVTCSSDAMNVSTVQHLGLSTCTNIGQVSAQKVSF